MVVSYLLCIIFISGLVYYKRAKMRTETLPRPRHEQEQPAVASLGLWKLSIISSGGCTTFWEYRLTDKLGMLRF